MGKLTIVEVAPGIWSVRRGERGSAAYIVKTSPGAVLVDGGADPAGVDVLRGLQAARVGANSLAAILLTHAHRHAARGAGALRDRSGARILCSRAEQAASADPAPSGLRRFLGSHVSIPVEPDGHLGAGDVFEGFEVMATPGHTEGHLSFLYRPARVLFTGDALRGLRSTVSLARRTRSTEISRESLRRCLGAGAALLLPCHGPAIEPAMLEGLDELDGLNGLPGR